MFTGRVFFWFIEDGSGPAEIRMLKWMYGYTRIDQIKNEVFRKSLGVASISDKIREVRLRWFRYVNKRQTMSSVRAVESLTVEGKRSKSRLKLTWGERITHGVLDLHLSKEILVRDRSSWRQRVKIKEF